MRQLYAYVANESTPNNQNYVQLRSRASCFLVYFVAVTANYSQARSQGSLLPALRSEREGG